MSATLGVKIRVFVPKEVFKSEDFQRNMLHTMVHKTIPDLRAEFSKTYSTWSSQGYPNFTAHYYAGVRVLWVKVFTYSQKYRLVNAGAGPHVIRARKGRLLRFRVGYVKKTYPRILHSYIGGRYGAWIGSQMVNHPGFPAREFDQEIAEQYQDTFAQDVQDAITGAIPGA